MRAGVLADHVRGNLDPEIAAKPLMERALYAHKIDVRMDHPQEAEAYLRHRAGLLAMVNNADGYVLIDGNPGGYPGAKASDFMKSSYRPPNHRPRRQAGSENAKSHPLDLGRMGHQRHLGSSRSSPSSSPPWKRSSDKCRSRGSCCPDAATSGRATSGST